MNSERGPFGEFVVDDVSKKGLRGRQDREEGARPLDHEKFGPLELWKIEKEQKLSKVAKIYPRARNFSQSEGGSSGATDQSESCIFGGLIQSTVTRLVGITRDVTLLGGSEYIKRPPRAVSLT